MSAHSLTPAPEPERALSASPPGLPFAVAFSGGADSTALLLASVQLWPGQVRAVHIHHGLSSQNDVFEAFCRQVCERWSVPLAVCHVDARAAAGDSPEATARHVRYSALAQTVTAQWGGVVRDVLTAQHADDQIETLLLALSRGSGLPGLMAMPARWQRDGLSWHRPFLSLPQQVLRQYLQAQGQDWVEDSSNTDERFTRNRIRAHVLPALERALPGFRAPFARSIAHTVQAQHLLDEWTRQDLARVGTPPQLPALQALPSERQAAVLRAWLKGHPGAVPSTAQLRELQKQVQRCTTRAHHIHLRVGAGWVVREGAGLAWHGPAQLGAHGHLPSPVASGP